MSGKTVYIITGANRGIGYGLAIAISARENTVVFAAARESTTQSLKDLSAKYPNVHPVRFSGSPRATRPTTKQPSPTSKRRLVNSTSLSRTRGSLATTPLSEFRNHWEVNTLDTVVLFHATHTPLVASPTGGPIFAYIPARALSGNTSAAANFLVKALDAENPRRVAMAVLPGWVATDMGNVTPDTLEEVEDGVSLEFRSQVRKSLGHRD